MNKLVTIEHPTRTTSAASGARVAAFGASMEDQSVYAAMTPRTAREQIRAGQTVASGQYLFEMRYGVDVDEKCRLKVDGRSFNITSIVNVGERNVDLEILATEAK